MQSNITCVVVVTEEGWDPRYWRPEIKVTPADGPHEGSYEIIGDTIYQGGLFFAGGAKDRTGVRRLTSRALNRCATAAGCMHCYFDLFCNTLKLIYLYTALAFNSQRPSQSLSRCFCETIYRQATLFDSLFHSYHLRGKDAKLCSSLHVLCISNAMYHMFAHRVQRCWCFRRREQINTKHNFYCLVMLF
jgi:hypothetical protein